VASGHNGRKEGRPALFLTSGEYYIVTQKFVGVSYLQFSQTREMQKKYSKLLLIFSNLPEC
jgi:hypothetical protein